MSFRILNYTGMTILPRERTKIATEAAAPVGYAKVRFMEHKELASKPVYGQQPNAPLLVTCKRGSVHVEGLPAPSEGVIYLVSCSVYTALCHTRNDLAVLSGVSELGPNTLTFDHIVLMVDD